MRIRTDNGNEHRREVIENAADAWGTNRTTAVVRSCELSRVLLEDLEEWLSHPDLPPRLKRELLEDLEDRMSLVGLETEFQPSEVHIGDRE